MKIKTINTQSRRDFRADIECEHCGHIEENVSGYDDTYFHSIVIPKMKCKSCKKSAGDKYRAITTKYPNNQVI